MGDWPTVKNPDKALGSLLEQLYRRHLIPKWDNERQGLAVYPYDRDVIDVAELERKQEELDQQMRVLLDRLGLQVRFCPAVPGHYEVVEKDDLDRHPL